MLGETHFDGRGQESDSATMDYAVMIENHGVRSHATSYQKTGQRTNISHV